MDRVLVLHALDGSKQNSNNFYKLVAFLTCRNPNLKAANFQYPH